MFNINELERSSNNGRDGKCPIYDLGGHTEGEHDDDAVVVPGSQLFQRASSFPSHNSPPTFIIWSSSNLGGVVRAFNRTRLRCEQENDYGALGPDSSVLFLANGGVDLISVAERVFAPGSPFRSSPRVAIASTSRGGKIVITSYDFFWTSGEDVEEDVSERLRQNYLVDPYANPW